jgi:hypothetical protein
MLKNLLLFWDFSAILTLWWDLAECGWDLAEWLESLAVYAKVGTVLGLIKKNLPFTLWLITWGLWPDHTGGVVLYVELVVSKPSRGTLVHEKAAVLKDAVTIESIGYCL